MLVRSTACQYNLAYTLCRYLTLCHDTARPAACSPEHTVFIAATRGCSHVTGEEGTEEAKTLR